MDPTWLPHEINAIREELAQIQGDRPLYLLFTHSDYDHIIAWKAFPNTQVIVSRAFVENPDWKQNIEQILDFDGEYYVSRDYPILYPKGDIIVKEEGETIEIGQTRLTFYGAAGHNVDGIFTIVEPFGLWIAGDYLSNIEFPYIYHSSTEYEKTLAKVDAILEKHHIEYLITGHGDFTKDKAEIVRRKEEGLNYIQELRASIKEGASYQEDLLWQQYSFKRGMRGFHEKNIQLIKRELGVS